MINFSFKYTGRFVATKEIPKEATEDLINIFEKEYDKVKLYFIGKYLVYVLESFKLKDLLQMKNVLSKELGKKYRIGFRKLEPYMLIIEADRKLDFQFYLDYIQTINKKCFIIKGLKEKEYRNHNPQRILRMIRVESGDIKTTEWIKK